MDGLGWLGEYVPTGECCVAMSGLLFWMDASQWLGETFSAEDP
jgi:hypothetical protein